MHNAICNIQYICNFALKDIIISVYTLRSELIMNQNHVAFC